MVYLKECITTLTNYFGDCVVEIWWVYEFGTLYMSRVKWLGLVSLNLTSLKRVVWAVLGEVVQNNASFGLRDGLELHLAHN